MTHTENTTCTDSAARSAAPATLTTNSLIGRMLNTKKHLKAYLKGEISLADLEARGIELV